MKIELVTCIKESDNYRKYLLVDGFIWYFSVYNHTENYLVPSHDIEKGRLHKFTYRYNKKRFRIKTLTDEEVAEWVDGGVNEINRIQNEIVVSAL